MPIQIAHPESYKTDTAGATSSKRWHGQAFDLFSSDVLEQPSGHEFNTSSTVLLSTSGSARLPAVRTRSYLSDDGQRQTSPYMASSLRPTTQASLRWSERPYEPTSPVLNDHAAELAIDTVPDSFPLNTRLPTHQRRTTITEPASALVSNMSTFPAYHRFDLEAQLSSAQTASPFLDSVASETQLPSAQPRSQLLSQPAKTNIGALEIEDSLHLSAAAPTMVRSQPRTPQNRTAGRTKAESHFVSRQSKRDADGCLR